MANLEELLKLKVDEINSREKKLKKVNDWVEGYRGKIIQIKSMAGVSIIAPGSACSFRTDSRLLIQL